MINTAKDKNPFSKIEIFGHRGMGCSLAGGDSYVPENSFAAFENAVELGLDGIELDVWLTKDEQVIVLHGAGSDVEGYLYETVIDVGFKRESIMQQTLHQSKREISTTSTADTCYSVNVDCQDNKLNSKDIICVNPLDISHNKNDSKQQFSIEEKCCNRVEFTKNLDQSDDPPRKLEITMNQLDTPESKYSFNKNQNTPKSIQYNDQEKVLVALDAASCLKRIEEICYSDYQLSGQLRLKEPWSLYQHRRSTKMNSTDIRNLTDGYAKSSCEEPTLQNLNETPNCERIEITDEQLHLEIPANFRSEMFLHLFYFERPLMHLHQMVQKQEFHKLTHLQKQNEIFDYLEDISGFKNKDRTYAEVPLLSQVFQKFYNRIRFNVELKGTNPKLGLAVLKLAQPFPGIIARISSFSWYIPCTISSHYDMNWSNIHFSDLLRPMIKNQYDIPLALLFGGYRLPSINLIIKALEEYQSEWVHLPQSFVLSDPHDLEQANALKTSFEQQPNILMLLKTLPYDLEPKIENEHLLYARFNSLRQEEKDSSPAYFTQKTVYLELLHLYYICKVLHQHGYKILVYSGRSNEIKSILQLVILCGVDALCPNNVVLAQKVIKHGITTYQRPTE